MERTHFGQHGADCFGCRVQSINFAPSVFETTSGGAKAKRTKNGDRTLVKDMDAYKRMRQGGLDPKALTGAARMEQRAGSEYEVVSGQLAENMAKGRDASGPDPGKEWRGRAEEAYQATKRGEVIDLAG